MSAELGLTLASFLAQITGYSIADVLKQPSKSKKDWVNLSIVRLLAIFENKNDPLTGLWDLNRWDMKPSETKKYVTGKLAILYRIPESDVWKGIMYLKYCRNPTDKGWRAKRGGDITEASYTVEISKQGKTTYQGTSTQIYRKPKKELMHSGEFHNIKISDGKITCMFINTNSRGKAHAVFHQRKRWKEVDSLDFLS
jgi:hypothetical protein